MHKLPDVYIGGGQCLTSRDCFYHNGTCTSGQCNCLGAYTGRY